MTLPVKGKCFWTGIFRLKRVSKIALAVFPNPKCFSFQIFRVKTSFQNWLSEFGTDYGMADVGAGGWALPAPPALAGQAGRPPRPRPATVAPAGGAPGPVARPRARARSRPPGPPGRQGKVRRPDAGRQASARARCGGI